MADKYFVQQLDPDGVISLSVNTADQIIDMFGFRDCTDCEYEVFKADEFGKLVRLQHVPAMQAPFNWHTFINTETGEVEFEGFSPEH